MSSRRRQHLFTITAALAGFILLAWAARRAGISDIIDGIQRVGWGLIPILGLGGLRFVVRAEAWRLCAPSDGRLPWRQAFTAFLAGDALGNVTPLGLLASEPTKVFLTRHHLATRESISSLAIDNVLYSASIVTMVGGSGVVLLLTVPLPYAWREWGSIALALLFIGAIVFVRLLRGSSGAGALIPARWRERAASLRGSVLEFSSGHPLRLWRVYALDLVFHALAVLEAFLALRWLLGATSPSLLQALLFEALNRVVTVLFKFVPFRAGVDEVSSGGMARLLGMDPVTGVALAIVRKVRNLFWAGIGMTIIAVRPGPAAPATDHL